jgi:very-short-patch-repair endonuclease
MTEWKNHWDAIRHFYRMWTPMILRQRQDEWAMDPYEWDNGMIQMTPIEYWLWGDIRENNLILYPQYPVGGMFVDFGNPVARIAIECDGAAYHKDKEKDRARDARLRDLGWSVYRITGSQCATEYDDETRTEGYAHEFLRQIGESRQIRRLCMGDPIGSSEWLSMEESFSESVVREMLIRAQVREMVERGTGARL